MRLEVVRNLSPKREKRMSLQNESDPDIDEEVPEENLNLQRLKGSSSIRNAKLVDTTLMQFLQMEEIAETDDDIILQEDYVSSLSQFHENLNTLNASVIE
jgi:hypothetical protein